jgi:hypothetical protein
VQRLTEHKIKGYKINGFAWIDAVLLTKPDSLLFCKSKYNRVLKYEERHIQKMNMPFSRVIYASIFA